MKLQGRNLSSGMRGDDVALLQEELGRLDLGVTIPELEIDRRLFGNGTNAAVIAFQRRFGIEATGMVDEITAARINAEVDAATPRSYMVHGRVVSRGRAGVGGLRVEIVDKGVGGDFRLARAETDDAGGYRAVFSSVALEERGKTQPDLQARAFAGETLLGSSQVRYNASPREKLDIRVAEEAESELASEYETLSGSLRPHLRGGLGELEENNDRQDITYLANKTGWDARAVALAALAYRFSAQSADAAGRQIEPELFYALFRAGLPADEGALYRTHPDNAAAVWQRAVEQGVLPASMAERIPQAAKRFERLAGGRMLDTPAPAGASTLRGMLSLSLGDDDRRNRRYVELHTAHADEPERLWKAVREEFGEETEQRLKIDTQLGFLTLDNAPLIRRLHERAGSERVTDSASLVGQGYFRAERWRDELGEVEVPRSVPGRDEDERRDRYAELMAAQLRLSYPTAVVGEMVRSGETPVAEGARDRVHAFLSEHQGRFEIGMQPIQQYLARNELQPEPELTREIKRLQRAYQISPSDDAMNTLLRNDFDSAWAVIRYDRDEFVEAFKEELGGEREAMVIHAKAQQVHNAVLNIATNYLVSRTAPAIGVHSPAQIIDPSPEGPNPEAPNAGDVIAYSTLEDLFGEMDFCACDHCRSILSPAAYLVDLLLYCDRPVNEKENPLDVLVDRRPDIEHLPLTCENTNTALPYLDLVNETLEYYVTNNLSLTSYTGHDTDGSATSEELLASPQFVSDTAYNALAAEHFPPPLPFHRPLESMRRFFDRFEAPLPEVMELLRTDDSLERAIPDGYGWRDILMEVLHLNRAEHAILTDRGLGLQRVYGYEPATPEAQVLAELAKARDFSRRVGISYEELFEILRTRFVNPNAELIPKLERLGVPFSTLKALEDGALSEPDFEALLPPGLDASHYGGDVAAWVKDEANYARIMGLIVLANPGDEGDLCSFDKVELRYSDPDQNANTPGAFDYVRLIRFIRLWKKLGWTIRQTDAAITALYPPEYATDDPSDAVNFENLDDGFLALLPRLGMLKRVMATLRLKTKRDLLPLLACFAPIDTVGPASLYRQMFLSAPPDEQDAAFADDGFGGYLTDANQKLKAHAESLRAAFRLTDGELGEVSAALGFDGDTPLDLDNISAIFRRGWLARELKLSVRELQVLMRFTGLDPFAAPDPPGSDILKFCELVQRLSAASLKPVQALYLIWNQDISGRSAPDDVELHGFARGLRSGLAAVEREFVLVEDPEGEIARARMALVYGNEATDLFFGLLDNTMVSEVSYSHSQPELEQPVLDAAPGRIAYDDFRKRLSFSGAMDTTTRDALQAAAAAELATAIDELYEENSKIVGPFFARYQELRPLYDGFVGSIDPPEKRRTDLLAAFLPEMARLRKRQQALQAIAAAAKAELGAAGAVLDDAAVLHATDDHDRPAVDDLIALETVGLSARFFNGDSATGAVSDRSDAEGNLSYSPEGSNPMPANGNDPSAAISGIWSGFLEAPEDGFVKLRVEADSGATVALEIDGAAVSLVRDGDVWSNDQPIELRAGSLHTLTLQVEAVKDRLDLQWQRAGSGWQLIPARLLYSETLTANLRGLYTRFLKTVSLADELELSPAEIAHLATDADYHIDGRGWLNALPVTGDPDGATSTALLEALDATLEFARIKAEVSPDDERLLAVLRDPVAATVDADALLPTLTRWDPDSLAALLARFGATAVDLGRLATLRRVEAAFRMLDKLRVSAPALIRAATNEPDSDTVRAFRAALRARYASSDWLDVLQPINDELRELRRDALVAHILHRMRSIPSAAHIDTPDKLFEYFLMDVQMAACMQTSRIRHALSSVQLFIERCLMNLEPRVAPSSINAGQWEWMRRYRVWEANRKVFLHPENWLDPELRDDQSPFFTETMSELLQSDITEDKAATALMRYLTKLDEVAKLEPCGIHFVENDPGASDDVAHVVARSPGAKSKYFYRRREYGYWTPWQEVKVDIDDNPVLPVVWKGRLFLFWLKIVQRTTVKLQALPSGNLADIEASDLPLDPPPVDFHAILCWSEHFNHEWLPPRTSDVDGAAFVTRMAPEKFKRSTLRLAAVEVGDALRILITDDDPGAAYYHLYNTHSLPRWGTKVNYVHELPRVLDTAGNTLTVEYEDPTQAAGILERSVLKTSFFDRTVEPRHALQNSREAPFFYEDGRHVFWVSTEERSVKFPLYQLRPMATGSKKVAIELPPMVFEELAFDPDPIGPVLIGRTTGAVDPAPMERFISEDAYINKGLGTTGTVSFGDRQIGPAGSFKKRP